MNIIEAIKSEIPQPYGKPTDIIGFGVAGKNIAETLSPLIGQKEICFFDEEIKSDPSFHYLDFSDMLAKTEIMIFTTELSPKYYKDLARVNPNVKIFVTKDLPATVAILEELQLRYLHYDEADIKSERSCGCIIVKDGKVLLTGALTDEGDLYWAFPKGHQEDGETDIETAIRETKEEVGLDVKIIDENPIVTSHFTHNKTSYKTIPLFIAEPLNDEIEIEENEIEKAEWVSIAEAGKYFDDYYNDAWAEFLKRIPKN